jgi:hypothetical protein
MFDLGFLLGTLPGFVLLLSFAAVVGLLYLVWRSFKPRHSHDRDRLD